MFLSLSILIAFAVFAAFVCWAGFRRNADSFEPEWLYSFSAARYRPMLRMLSEEDYAWLAQQGMDRSAIRELRTRRREIFKTYLTNLDRDFNRLHATARNILLTAQEDRPELTARLIQLRFDFQKTVLFVRACLWVESFGVRPADVSRLVEAIETVHQDLRTLQPALSSASA